MGDFLYVFFFFLEPKKMSVKLQAFSNYVIILMLCLPNLQH